MEKICVECGRKFTTRFENLVCRKCISNIISQETGDKPETKVKKDDVDIYYDVYVPRTRIKPQIVIDASRALMLGISYGEYMSNKIMYERKAFEMESIMKHKKR